MNSEDSKAIYFISVASTLSGIHQQTIRTYEQKGLIKPIVANKKIGRNEKIFVQSPNGEKVQIKYKKLQQYLKQGYTQV